MSSHTISAAELHQWRRAVLTQAALPEAEVVGASLELDWLLQSIAGLDRLALRLATGTAPVQLSLSLPELTDLWQRRIHERVPVQYLVGETAWRHFRLSVSQSVLIPRPETEGLVDLALAAVQATNQDLGLDRGHWADLGTGSGAIAVGLASVFPASSIQAVDCSRAALAVAQQNARQLGLADRIHFYQGSWLEPLAFLKRNLSGVVTNPPYIPTRMIPELQPEVALHEPHIALDGGEEGLDCIRHLIATAPDYLKPGGIFLSEIMAGQASSVIELLHQSGHYRQIQVHRDLSGVERFALAYHQV